MSPTPTATDPPPADSPTMHSSLVRQGRHFCFGDPAYLSKNYIKTLKHKKKTFKQKKRFLSLPRGWTSKIFLR